MHRFLLLATLTIPACMKGGIAVLDDTGQPDGDTDTDTDADGDTDADADADADTDADADADADSDADSDPQVDCGPWRDANDSGSIWAGEGVLVINDDWHWEGCEVERRFGSGGALECELLWSVEGDYYAWDAGSWTARYRLRFVADEGASTCEVSGSERDYVGYYEAVFDWHRGEMELLWSEDGNGRFDDFTTADIEQAGNEAPFTYVSDLW
jgi:hypothetical protein